MLNAIAVIGFASFMIGVSGYDSNPIIAITLIFAGMGMMFPYVKRYEREEEIRQRREPRIKNARQNGHSKRAM